jgi:hypothetical protein
MLRVSAAAWPARKKAELRPPLLGGGSGDRPDKRGLDRERERIDPHALEPVAEPRADRTRVPAGEDAGHGRARVGRLREQPLVRLGGGALRRAEERRPELDALRAERERSGDAATVHDRAGGDHRHAHAVDDLWKQREAAHQRVVERMQEPLAMAAGLAPLRDDEVHARLFERGRLGCGRCRARSARPSSGSPPAAGFRR